MPTNDEWPTKREGFRAAGWFASGTAFLVIVGILITVAVGTFVYVWAPWKGQIEARNNTLGNGQYVVASYDYYFDQCGAIQAAEKRIQTFNDQLKTDPAPSSDQVARLQAGIMGNTNIWIDLVTEYNANADKEKYKGQFRSDNLPAHIELDNLTNGVVTTCA